MSDVYTPGSGQEEPAVQQPGGEWGRQGPPGSLASRRRSRITRGQETYTFVTQPRGRLFRGTAGVAICVILAAVVAAQPDNGVLFKTLWVVAWALFAALLARMALMRVQVRGGKLIVRNYFRTRTVNASEIRGITWDWLRGRVAPRVHLAGGGSVLLAAFWSYGSRKPQLVATVEEILSLLGVQLPVQEQSPGWSPDWAPTPESPSGLPDSSAVRPASEPIGVVEDKAAFLARAKSPAGLPGESVGARRPPRQNHRGWRIALSFLPGVLLGTWLVLAQLNANSAWAMVSLSLFIVSFCILAAVRLVRMIVQMQRNRRGGYPPSPPSGH